MDVLILGDEREASFLAQVKGSKDLFIRIKKEKKGHGTLW
jgi:hypothetical protein